MNGSTSQKIKLLVLYELLYRLTDEEHLLNTDEIINLLQEKGITVSRKILREDIKTLNDYGYEVMEVKKKYFYYYVANRQFENAEIALLADVVAASKLNVRQKEGLINKLAYTLGSHKAMTIMNNVLSYDRPKHTNAHIIYSIDSIENAINEKKKISFKYYSLDHEKNKVYHKDGQRYIVNPIVMVWNKDNYYLVCYDDKHEGTANYRIDRMESVAIEKEDRTPNEKYENFDTEQFRTQVFSMFGGETRRVELEFSSVMIDEVFDTFGEEVKIKKQGDKYRIAVPIQISKNFYTWVIGSQGNIKILSPKIIKEDFNSFIKTIKEEY